MSKDLTKDLSELSDTVKDYLQTKIDLVKLSFLEKMTKMASFMISIQIIIWFAFIIFILFIGAFLAWYQETYHNLLNGIYIACVIVFLIGLAIVVLSKTFVANILVRNFSKIIFEDDEETQD
jgi:hypothetical protein